MNSDLRKAPIHRMLLVFAAVLALAAGSVHPAYAAEKAVVYDGTVKEWHGEGLDEQDVFMRSENVMPGDTLEHSTRVRIDRPSDPVTIYVRLECSEDDVEKLDEIECELLADGVEVFAGSLGDIAGTAVKIGAYDVPDAVDLTLRILVPTSLENEHQFIEYPLNWRFIAQEDGGEGPGGGDGPTDPDEPDGPDEPGGPDEPSGPDEPGGPTDPDVPGDGDKPGIDPEGPSAGGSDLLPQTGESWLTVYGPLTLGLMGVLAVTAGLLVIARRRGKKKQTK